MTCLDHDTAKVSSDHADIDSRMECIGWLSKLSPLPLSPCVSASSKEKQTSDSTAAQWMLCAESRCLLNFASKLLQLVQGMGLDCK